MHPECERSGHQTLLTLIFNSHIQGKSILRETKNPVPLHTQDSPHSNRRLIVKYHREKLVEGRALISWHVLNVRLLSKGGKSFLPIHPPKVQLPSSLLPSSVYLNCRIDLQLQNFTIRAFSNW